MEFGYEQPFWADEHFSSMKSASEKEMNLSAAEAASQLK
jgi:hypothetical protein